MEETLIQMREIDVLARHLMEEYDSPRYLNAAGTLYLCEKKNICPLCNEKVDTLSKKNKCCKRCRDRFSQHKHRHKDKSLEELYETIWKGTRANICKFGKLHQTLTRLATPEELTVAKNTKSCITRRTASNYEEFNMDEKLIEICDIKIQNILLEPGNNMPYFGLKTHFIKCKHNGICPLCGSKTTVAGYRLEENNFHCNKCSQKVSRTKQKTRLELYEDIYVSILIDYPQGYVDSANALTRLTNGTEDEFYIQQLEKAKQDAIAAWQKADQKQKELQLKMQLQISNPTKN